jgi:cephalosporin hydroxylase
LRYAALPPPVAVALEETVRDYWLRRVDQHIQDTYAGVRMSKFPEDLRVYEHLIWQTRAEVVIELGTHLGGSTLWFRDRLRAAAGYGRIGRGRLIAVDIEIEAARAELARVDAAYEHDIVLLAGDVCDPDLPARVAAYVPDGARCLVVEDSAHVFAPRSPRCVGSRASFPSVACSLSRTDASTWRRCEREAIGRAASCRR